MLTFKQYTEQKDVGGQAPGKLDIRKTSVEEAHDFADRFFKKNQGKSVDELIPDFNKNFNRAKKLATEGFAIRKDMPVINDSQVRQFQQRLKEGDIDRVRPFAPETNPKNPFPEGLTGRQAKLFLTAGLRDGDEDDDDVKVTQTQSSAGILHPIQKQIYIDKSVGPTSEFGITKTRAFLKKSFMIQSRDHRIIDGHHRWLSTMILDPGIKMPSIQIMLPIRELLPLSIAYGDSIGNRRNR